MKKQSFKKSDIEATKKSFDALRKTIRSIFEKKYGVNPRLCLNEMDAEQREVYMQLFASEDALLKANSIIVNYLYKHNMIN